MKMNKKGAGSGIALILFLCVALLVAYLFMTQMGSLGFGPSGAGNSSASGSSNGPDGSGTSSDETGGQGEQNPVDAAKDAVDQYNQKLDEQYDEYED